MIHKPVEECTHDCPIWQTAQGDEIPLCQMATSHIRNCIRFLERKMPEVEEALEHFPSFQSEMAQDMAESETGEPTNGSRKPRAG